MKLLVFTCLDAKNKKGIHDLVANIEDMLRQNYFGGEKICATFFHSCSNTKEHKRLCEVLKKNGDKIVLFTEFCGEKRFENVRKTISKIVDVTTVKFITTDPGLKVPNVPVMPLDEIGAFLEGLKKIQKEPEMA